VTPRRNDSFGELERAYISLSAPLWQLPEELKQVLLDSYRHTHLNALVGYDGKEYCPLVRQSWIKLDVHEEGRSIADVMGEVAVTNTDFCS
jgi:hypothetical protein